LAQKRKSGPRRSPRDRIYTESAQGRPGAPPVRQLEAISALTHCGAEILSTPKSRQSGPPRWGVGTLAGVPSSCGPPLHVGVALHPALALHPQLALHAERVAYRLPHPRPPYRSPSREAARVGVAGMGVGRAEERSGWSGKVKKGSSCVGVGAGCRAWVPASGLTRPVRASSPPLTHPTGLLS